MASPIVKTRQAPPDGIVEVFDPEVGRARGVLRRPVFAGSMSHSRRLPSPQAASAIAHYWIIHWDLTGCDPHVAESVPHPNIHLVCEPTGSTVCGVQSRKFSRLLQGQSQVFGVKFRPGGFRPFFHPPLSRLSDRIVPAQSIFGDEIASLEAVVLSSVHDDEKVEAANAFFAARLPEPDKTAILASQLVERILNEPAIKTVDDLVTRAGIGKRSLQRIFSDYVGVSPKWVIRRYRLHELLEKFHAGGPLDWPQVALELGYFDQAHLINDFKAIVGFSPTQYGKLIATAPGPQSS